MLITIENNIRYDSFAGDVYTLDTAGITLTSGTFTSNILKLYTGVSTEGRVDTTDGVFALYRFSDTAIQAPVLKLLRARNDGVFGYLSVDDRIGDLKFAAFDAAGFAQGDITGKYKNVASIHAYAELDHATGDLPTALGFSTTGDGEGVLSLRWTMTGAGHYWPGADNVYDIGDPGGTLRPRSINCGTVGKFDTLLLSTGSIVDTIGPISFSSGNLSGTGNLDFPELFNSNGDLKIMPDAQGNVRLFGDTDVDDASEGKRLIVSRKAAEGDNDLQMYVDAFRNVILTGKGNVFYQTAGASYYIAFNPILGTYINHPTSSSAASKWLRHVGRITAAGANKYIEWKVDDSDDYFKLTRQDANILGFKIVMPTLIGDGTTNYTQISATGAITQIGSATASLSTTDITSLTASTIPLTIKGAVSQTAYLQTWTDSSDAVLAQIQANGRIYTSNGIKADAMTGGGSLVLWPDGGVVIEHDLSANEADFDYTEGTYESWMHDASGVFTAADVGKWIIVRTGTYRGAMAGITEVIDADNVILHTMGWDFDITDFGYYIIEHPQVVIGDGYHNEFQCNSMGHVDIHSSDWIGNEYSKYLFEVELDAGADDADGGLFQANANGHSSVQALTLDYVSGALGAGETGGCIGARLTVTNAAAADSATEVDAYLAAIINGSDATATAYKVLPGFDNALVVQGATAANPDYGYEYDDSTDTMVDRVNSAGVGNDAFINSDVDEELFDAVNDYILIGDSDTFEVIEYVADTGGSKNINATFEYSTGNDTWANLTILSDGTDGFQKSGQISFNAPIAWAESNASDTEAITAGYYVRITRTRAAAIVTLPKEDHFKIYSSRELGMRIRGDGVIKAPYLGTAPADLENGMVWMEDDGLHLYYGGAEKIVAGS